MRYERAAQINSGTLGMAQLGREGEGGRAERVRAKKPMVSGEDEEDGWWARYARAAFTHSEKFAIKEMIL